MDYDKINREADKPGLDLFAQDWKKAIITALQPTDSRLLAVVEALESTHVNGGAEVAQFRIDSLDAVHWCLSRDRVNEVGFFRHFFSHPDVLKAFPLMSAPNALVDRFEMEGSFTAIGRLAQVILQGGAYKNFARRDSDVTKLAEDFGQAAFGGRYSTTVVWVNWTAWCSYFCDIAGDCTFVFFDKAEGVLTVLMSTDTD